MKYDPRKKKPVDICGPTRKRIFKSHENALEFIGSVDGNQLKRAYSCKYCGGWHVTSQS
jgi:hypothetical protein